MKTKAQLKAELNKLIDSIDDEELLNLLNDEIIPAIIENHSQPFSEDDENDSHEEQGIVGLNDALTQTNNLDPITPEEFKKLTEKWGQNKG